LKSANEAFRLAFLTIHLFAFALSLNLVYAIILQIFAAPDFVAQAIFNIFSADPRNLPQSTFAVIYGIPFLALPVTMLVYNSYRLHRWRMRIIIRSRFFWFTLVLALMLAVYQYMAFILVEAT